ncbi:membrane-spanning 4-domains subfamily A member 4A-like [Choloepus didactylus]|uniref:membrane-spanning 4-domains subfamily A member 4A-like n=1 Tax=Choloepus didactylus TaxID=27675 RepID=UPI00189D7BB5|nr:membrane-spanning 4-domains subfamily A member 4A-like [Choloepus didactylus]
MQRVNSNSWTLEAGKTEGFAINLPGSENIVHPGQWRPCPPLEAFPASPQNNLLIFLKGQPQVLGVAQIMIGLMELCLWVTSLASYTDFSFGRRDLYLVVITGYPVWGSLFFFTSGTLSIAAGRKVTKGLIQGSMGMNIISVIIAGIGIFILTVTAMATTEGKNEYWLSEEHLDIIPLWQGMVTVMLILCVLEACIALSLSILGCKVACFVNQVVVYLPSQDNVASVASPEHIYDDVIFQ